MFTTLLKVYVRGGLFEKSRELLVKLESLGYAQEEVPLNFCLFLCVIFFFFFAISLKCFRGYNL